MYVSDEKFLFLHLHKCGGQYVARFLRSHFGTRLVGYHYPYSHIPHEFRNLPKFGVVRNPWDWYVSWYHFQKQGARNALFRVCSDDGKLGFVPTIANLLCLSEDKPRLQKLSEQLPVSIVGNRGMGVTRADLETLHPHAGWYSWLAHRMLNVRAPFEQRPFYCRLEHLGKEIQIALQAMNVSVTDDMRFWLARYGPVNTSIRDHYSHYYNDDLRFLVEKRDEAIVDNFGYTFCWPSRAPASGQTNGKSTET